MSPVSVTTKPSFYLRAQKTEITLQADYLNDDWTPDFGTAIIGKSLLI
jgi:iron complex outermembrane receptor protein